MSEWSTGKTRRCRIYSIRKHGRAVLEEHLREWRLFARSVERILAA